MQPGAIAVDHGEEGKVLKEVKNGWIKVWLPRKGIQGSVPEWAVDVHTAVKFGELQIKHDIPYISSSGVDYTKLELKPKNKLEQAIVAMIDAMKNRQNSLPFMNDGIRNLLNDDRRRLAFLSTFISGLISAYVTVANNDQSTLEDFMASVKQVNSNVNRTGLYVRITSQFPNEPQRRPEFYTGETQDSFANRLQGHRNSNSTEFTHSVLSARAAEKLSLRPVCLMPKGDLTGMLLAEQVLLLLHGSYIDDMYVDKIDRVSTSTKSSEEEVREVVKAITKREMAYVLNSIARTVCNEINFTPLCKRSNFGTGAGLNYNSLISEGNRREKTLWIQLVNPGVMEVYYREGVKFGTDELASGYRTNFMNVDREEGATTMGFSFRKDEKRPPLGALVYPIWEISLTGEHPYAWARLPTIGKPKDWNLANQLALRIEFQEENGQWNSAYQQADTLLKFERTSTEGIYHTYNLAMTVIRALKQVQPFNPPKWMYSGGICRVKQLTFDHPTQTVILQELAPPSKTTKKFQTKTDNEIQQEMIKAGCVNVNGTWLKRGWRGKPGPFVLGEQSIKRCDQCYILSHFDGLLRKSGLASQLCERIKDKDGNETNRCRLCQARGLFCSFTRVADINDDMVEALNFRTKQAHEWKQVKPRILYLGKEFIEEDKGDEPETDN